MDNKTQKSNSNKKTTSAQFSVLVKEMENNPNIGQNTPASGGFASTTREPFWNGLAFKLNALGPKKRTTGEWKKVWSELKLRTTRKLAGNGANLADMENGTGSITDSSHDGHMTDQALQAAIDTSTPFAQQDESSTSGRRISLGHAKTTRYECESLELLRRQVENEEKLTETLNRSNELKQQQLKLMVEQNRLINTTIECVNNLSLKFNKFVGANK